MREPRNPFRLRAAEHIETDVLFVRLFEPSMLDVLPENELWDRPQVLRSAPGAGKTSLLRLFTPTALLNLHALRSHDDTSALFQKLCGLGVIDDSGPRMLGVLLSCARNYATLEDLDCDGAKKKRLLFGLLNARILLTALRGAVALRRLTYPADLSRIELRAKSAEGKKLLEKVPTKGQELHDWATELERKVCEAIDSFGPFAMETVQGDETLSSLLILKETEILVDGHPVADRLVVMLDDVHRLTQSQRRTLFDAVIELRVSVGLWIAERFEALSTTEMLSVGATQGRDFGEVILLEQFWRKHPRRFEHLVMNIADRRAKAALDGLISSLSGCLEDTLDSSEWTSRHQEIRSIVEQRVQKIADENTKFADWMIAGHLREGTPRSQAVAWRSLEILVHRELNRSQQAFDFTLTTEDLDDKDDSAVRTAADLFLSTEFNLPFYFGPMRLAALASSNVEQFLRLAGDEFEELISSALLKKEAVLRAPRQQSIVQKGAEAYWKDIPRRARNPRDVIALLDSIGRFCRRTTYQPNAPYAPGVNGVAILMSDRERLQKSEEGSGLKRLADALASCLAQNLVDATLDYRCKGSNWMVLYLNRLVCARFSLPTSYGGFKEKTLKELTTWIEPGYREPRKEEALL